MDRGISRNLLAVIFCQVRISYSFSSRDLRKDLSASSSLSDLVASGSLRANELTVQGAERCLFEQLKLATSAQYHGHHEDFLNTTCIHEQFRSLPGIQHCPTRSEKSALLCSVLLTTVHYADKSRVG